MRRAFMAPEYRGMHDRGLSYPSRLAMIGELAVLPLLGPNGLTMGRRENSLWGGRCAGALAGLAALVVGVSCMPPDVPSRLSGSLPEAFLARLEPDSVRVRFVREGLSYHYLWSPKGPWAIHMLRLDLRRCDLGFEVLPAGLADPGGPGLSTVTNLVREAGPLVVAAVNGDFFTPEGRPVGPEVAVGRLLWSRSRPAFAWQPGTDPWIGTAELGDDGGLSAGSWIPREKAGQTQVVGGFPELLDGGRPVLGLALDRSQDFAAVRHPRTAVAYDPAGQTLWLMVVDGRQGAYSSGMTLEEVTGTFESLGATEALNLDGGGSSVMVVHGIARSRPSDADGERAVRNALAVVGDPEYCRALSGPTLEGGA